MCNLPKYLYRGDSVCDKNSLIYSALCISNFIPARLLQNGDPKYIFKKPIEELLMQHIGIGSDKSSFISFSENENIALYYAQSKNPNGEYCISRLDTEKFSSVMRIKEGVFRAIYPLENEINGIKEQKLLIINPRIILSSYKSNENAKIALENAKKDQEWLVLSENEFKYNATEYDGMLYVDDKALKITKISPYESCCIFID